MQVVSRKLRIGILPATVPRVTDARHTLCRESAPIRPFGLTPHPTFEDTSGYPSPDVLEVGIKTKVYCCHKSPQRKNSVVTGTIVAGVCFLRGIVDAMYTKDIPCSYEPKESDHDLVCSDPYRDLHWAGDQRLPAGRVLI